MRVAARRVVTVRHTYNLVDLPIVVAGKSGTAEFGMRDRQGRLPFSNWFVGFVPKEARKTAPTRRASRPSGARTLDLVVLAYAHDTRTAGNAATEIVKYFLQLHYGLSVDLRQRWVCWSAPTSTAADADEHAAPRAGPRRHAGGPRRPGPLVRFRPPAGDLRPRR